jgi:hypothetical protein
MFVTLQQQKKLGMEVIQDRKKLMTNKIAGEGWLAGDNSNLYKSNLFKLYLNESNLLKMDFVWFNFVQIICI